jgi:predicted protein tyrosine phosphatase
MTDGAPLLPHKLTICGLDELSGFAADGVSHVISIIDPEYPDPADFGRYGAHERETFRFDDVIDPRPGYTPPSADDIERLLDFGERLAAGPAGHLLVHCHAGISRSTAASAILLSQFNPGRELEAFRYVRSIRPRSWPNSRMVLMADAILGRDGALADALRDHFAHVAFSAPDLAEIVSTHGRAHEVPVISDAGAGPDRPLHVK